MAIITISAIELGPVLVAGIPRFVALETNVPATIFYTLDNSQPTSSSSVYLDPIKVPDNICALVLRAKAVSGTDVGYLYASYNTDSSELYLTRRVEGYGAGIVVDAYGKDWVFYDGYSVDDNSNVIVPARFSDYEKELLEIQYSKTGPNGIGPGTFPWPGPVPQDVIDRESAIGPEDSSPNKKNVFFDPRALYIVIDGKNVDGYVDQSVFPINRPLSGTMNVVKYMSGQLLRSSAPYVSGGHVRTFYNPNNNTMVCYYFDANECRWIKSIQNYDSTKVPENIASRRQCGPPLVFKWIYNKGQTLG
jgi:hypothetical protein